MKSEELDLTKILKDCPKGTRLYSTVFGIVTFEGIVDGDHPIKIRTLYNFQTICSNGRLLKIYEGECTLFPSKKNRDWNTFKVDLPIDTPVMCSNNKDHNLDWRIRYYAGNNRVFSCGYKDADTLLTTSFRIMIPYSKFDLNNIEESLKFNINN